VNTLSAQRCFHHSLREAVARCPECRHFYCRECITEHDDRVICATCLRKFAVVTEKKRVSFAWVPPILQLSVGVTVIWLFFYFFGAALLSIPSSFHEGEVWVEKWWQSE
jgi:hypothetical protein